MVNDPWYVKSNHCSAEEQWALEVLHLGGQEAIDILDERIRRLTKCIQMTWTESEAEKRFVGRARTPAYIPTARCYIDSSYLIDDYCD